MKIEKNAWIIEQNEVIKEKKDFYESIFSLGNGYMGVRGFDEEEECYNRYELCTYVAGIFDYHSTRITDMVNTPNFWKTKIVINGEKFSLDDGEIIEYRRSLHIDEGNIRRRIIWNNKRGDKTLIETTKCISIKSVHNALLSMEITPLNYSGEIQIETGIDFDVVNNLISDDQMKNDIKVCEFLCDGTCGISQEGVLFSRMKTKNSQNEIYESFDIEVLGDNVDYRVENEISQDNKYISKKIKLSVKQNETYNINKYISVWTSRDTSFDKLETAAIESTISAKKLGMVALLEENKKLWQEKWDIADIELKGDETSQKAIRYNIFQLIQANAENDPKVSIGARGVMHGRYKGCYFWDTEIFMLPFYLYTNPTSAKNLLMYRYHTLSGAEKNAKEQNVDGARYPWMSSTDGSEQCESWDIGFCEIHITPDIAYAINHYYQATGDIEFIRDYGIEILIKTARYCRSRFTYDEKEDEFNMLYVKGPNEYGGATLNNTYTSTMAIYNMQLAIKFMALMNERYPEEYKAIKTKLEFKESETDLWNTTIKKVVIRYDKDKKLYIEDDNFYKAEPLNIKEVKDNGEPLYKKISFDRLQRYRVLKQADVLLLMLLLPNQFTFEEKMAAWKEYEPITLHDSSLSCGTHAAIASRLGLMQEAYDYFVKSVGVDLYDVMANTGREGIHFASLGASWQAIFNGFAGIEVVDSEPIVIDPKLPSQWEELKLKTLLKGNLIALSISENKICVKFESGNSETIDLKICGELISVRNGDEKIIDIKESLMKYQI